MASEINYNREERILILAPTGRDAVLTGRILNEAGLISEVCRSAKDLCDKMREDAGLVFLTGEALTLETMSILVHALLQQDPWSDIPLIVLTSGGSNDPANTVTLEELARIGNVTLIERPVRLMTLISAVKSALRARNKQYEARDFLIAEVEAKEALRQSEERLRVALDAASMGAWELDLATQKIDCTEICLINYGLPPECELTYSKLLAIIDEEDREKFDAAMRRAINQRENYRAEYRVKWDDGSLRWILASGMVNCDESGAPFRVVGVTLDITERKVAEKQREEMLESEQSARAAAEAANRLKDEFLATVSHELRTPLNAMLGWTNLLRSGRLDPENSARALETVERNARTQAEIIEDLLDVSRIITGKLNLNVSAIDPIKLIQSAIESLTPAANAKNIDIRQTLAHTEKNLGDIKGDAARIQQIVWNLLSNAIKFTPAGGKVEVELSAEADNLIIAISDTGTGIKPEFLPFVFDRFLQADGTTTRSHGGLGLGLAIVRHLVELHGGSVQAESEGLGRGATFIVKLPFVQNAVPQIDLNGDSKRKIVLNADRECQNNLSGLKILVVDDEADSLELIRMFLEHCGAEVSTANSVSSALEYFDQKIPDLLISDIGMPDTDGYEFIKKIRELTPERGGLIPAIALTAYARSEDKSRALDSGFHTHLTKPIDMNSLVNVISDIADSN